MEYTLSAEDRVRFEEILKRAEPYPEDDPIWDTWDGERDHDRAMATIAKMALEGRLK